MLVAASKDITYDDLHRYFAGICDQNTKASLATFLQLSVDQITIRAYAFCNKTSFEKYNAACMELVYDRKFFYQL